MPAAAPSPHASVDFAQDVLEASRTAPVLVDFWAPWCGPCRTLGPVLERLAGEAAGRWTLRTVNTDEHPELMERYGIRGIPAVKLFVDGAVAAEFTGALPEYAVRQWLADSLPTAATRGLTAALTALQAGDVAAARTLLDEALTTAEEGPATDEAREVLARLIVLDDPQKAATLVADRYTPGAEAVKTLARLFALDLSALPDGPGREGYAAAAHALQRGDVDAALTSFIDTLVRDRAYDDDGARRAAVAIFQTLGENDPLTRKHRPAFNRSLY
ncbi:MAG TPA: tetratricopeptide repeat protein [Rhodothermales bacterium]|nr:tetratricopeptide repeat protein [Rhodothermales bacterium]